MSTVDYFIFSKNVTGRDEIASLKRYCLYAYSTKAGRMNSSKNWKKQNRKNDVSSTTLQHYKRK